MSEENIIKCEILVDKINYPKYAKQVDSGEYAIFSAKVVKVEDYSCSEYQTLKLKGNVCRLEYGSVYKVTCKFLEHHDIYGDSYEILYINKKIDISSKEKQKEFLSNIINNTIVDSLFKQYDDVIKLLDNKDVASLIQVKGIGNSTALRIIDEYEEAKDYSSIYTELGKIGISHTLIKKLTDFYKSPDVVIDVMKNNPYDLVRVDGIGFKKADEVALKLGVGQYDYRRIKGFLIHTLFEQGESGKSFLYYSELIKMLYEILGFVPEEVIQKTAKSMMDNNDVVVIDNGNKIALKKYYDLENNIALEFKRLINGRSEHEINSIELDMNEDDPFEITQREYIPKEFNISNWKKIITDVEDIQGYVFTDEQLEAIRMSLDSYVMALTGLAGSGKTSTANGICKLYNGFEIIAVALSGKASVRITEATGLPASTIHRALGYSNGQFTYNKYFKLPVDIVLIDEATMINGTLFLSLLEAIPSGAKVIIMGDVQQLTPIGNCQVFADILNSNFVPTIKLTKPHRQALLSGIIPTSIHVAKQEQIFNSTYEGKDVIGELQDMELDIYKSKADLSEEIVSHFKTQYEKINDIMEVQIVTPMKLKGDLSCYNLNTKLQEICNPIVTTETDDEYIEILLSKSNDEYKSYKIRVGDKVINTKNNYKCINSNGDISPVFNGNIGIVKYIENKYCTVDFVGIGEIILNKKESKSLELAYAISIHKSQGSGFTSVIVGLDGGSYILNNAELLYTGLTRAKKHCVLVGKTSAIRSAISKKEVVTKQTFLKDLFVSGLNE